jgi:hypothetical protein
MYLTGRPRYFRPGKWHEELSQKGWCISQTRALTPPPPPFHQIRSSAPSAHIFGQHTWGERPRASSARRRPCSASRNGYVTRQKSHDRSQPPAVPTAATALPAPWWVPLPSTCMRTAHKHIRNAILNGACACGSCCVHTRLWHVAQFSHIDPRARLPNHLPHHRRPGGPAPTSRTGAGSAAVASAGSAVPAGALMHRWRVDTASAHAQRTQPCRRYRHRPCCLLLLGPPAPVPRPPPLPAHPPHPRLVPCLQRLPSSLCL